MTEIFTPTPETTTIDGVSWKSSRIKYDDLDWGSAVWRSNSLIMEAIVGDRAPSDQHWSVKHKTEGSFHRIRLKKGKG